jgi:hypothetical protein
MDESNDEDEPKNDDCNGWKIGCESVSVGDEKVKI